MKAIKYDKTIPETYEKIGDILSGKEKYKEALNYYKVADQTGKVRDCYDKLIAKATKDGKLKLLEEEGDYLADTGQVHKAIKCYTKAKDLTYDKGIKTGLLKKIDSLLSGIKTAEIVKEHQSIESSGEFYKFDLVKPEELDLLLGDTQGLT